MPTVFVDNRQGRRRRGLGINAIRVLAKGDKGTL